MAKSMPVHGASQRNSRPVDLLTKPLCSRIRSQFPQFLHRGRYDELRKLWLSQGIPTFVARKLDATTDQGGWTTF